MEYWQPEEAEKAQEDQKFTPRSTKFLRPRPHKQQQETIDNHMMLILYQPCRFAIFRDVVDPKVVTWWMPYFTHFIQSRDAQGKNTTAILLCKRKMNAHYEQIYKGPVIFEAVRCGSCGDTGYFRHCVKCGQDLGVRLRDAACPDCDEADRWWLQWRNEWSRRLQALGYGADPKHRFDLKRKNLPQYNEETKSGTELRRLQDTASNYSASDRYLFAALDIDKLYKRRTIEEGEPPSPLMLLSQGGKVYEALRQKHKLGKQFWSPRAQMKIVLTRDTSKGVDRTTYTIDDAPIGSTVGEAPLGADWIAYLEDPANVPDPSDELNVVSYDEQARIGGLTLTREETVPVTNAAQPAAPMQPQPAAQQPYVPPAQQPAQPQPAQQQYAPPAPQYAPPAQPQPSQQYAPPPAQPYVPPAQTPPAQPPRQAFSEGPAAPAASPPPPGTAVRPPTSPPPFGGAPQSAPAPAVSIPLGAMPPPDMSPPPPAPPGPPAPAAAPAAIPPLPVSAPPAASPPAPAPAPAPAPPVAAPPGPPGPPGPPPPPQDGASRRRSW